MPVRPGVVTALFDGLQRVIRGKADFLSDLLTCLVARGHLLIEDVPGLGKTTVAKALAALIGGAEDGVFRRIQCTPDLLPYDITGVDVYDPDRREFRFVPGPVFCHVLLVDEVNRTTPKVQSALLEVMAEGQVTVGGHTRKLPPPFFVMATENPLDFEGTYRLPQAQADRFLMRLSIGYPDADAELSILRDEPADRVAPSLAAVCGLTEILELQAAASGVHCAEPLVRAAVRIAGLSRSHAAIELGISPRGTLMLQQAARSRAFILGRDYVTDEDMQELAPAVLAHRIRVRDPKRTAPQLVRELALEAFRTA